jgi:hypothetical protein
MQTMKFTKVKGKIIQTVELFISSEECIIDIGFQDKTSLTFDVEPCVVITPEFRTGKLANISRSSDGGLFTADHLAHKPPRRKTAFYLPEILVMGSLKITASACLGERVEPSREFIHRKCRIREFFQGFFRNVTATARQ